MDSYHENAFASEMLWGIKSEQCINWVLVKAKLSTLTWKFQWYSTIKAICPLTTQDNTYQPLGGLGHFVPQSFRNLASSCTLTSLRISDSSITFFSLSNVETIKHKWKISQEVSGGQDWKGNILLSPTFLWPELRHMTSSFCNESYKYSSVIRNRRKWGLEKTSPVCIAVWGQN